MVKTSSTHHREDAVAETIGQELSQAVVVRLFQLRVAVDQLEGFAAGQLEDLGIANDVGDTQAQQAALLSAVELAAAAQLQVHFGDAEAIAGGDHRLQALPAIVALRVGKQHAVRLVLAAPYPPAKLMELRQTEP